MERSRLAFIVVIALFVVALAVTSAVTDEHYMLISIVLVIAAMMPFFIGFERRDIQVRELVLVAMLAAIAAISRVPFGPLPSVQPTTFVIIVSALVFGRAPGFMIGALAALVSNLLLGQGPWTPWQMFGWGMAGWTAGSLKDAHWMGTRWGMGVFGFAWGFVFGWLMDVWTAIGVLQTFNWTAVLSVFAVSFYFDLAHALSNVFFLSLFGVSWIRILRRFKKKYGLL